MNELDQIAAAQRRDDTTYQDPQRIGGERTVSFEKFVERGRDSDGSDLETVRDTGDHGATEVGGVARPLPRWGINRVHPVHRPRTGREHYALSIAVEPFLKDLPIPQWDAVRLVIFGRLSQRQAATVLGVSQPAVFKRLRSAASNLRPAIEQRSGSEGKDFQPTRQLNERATCRLRPRDGYAHKCSGHFEAAVCDRGKMLPESPLHEEHLLARCVTILPLHYNAHTTCRAHSRGKTTRYEFNLAWLIGVGLQSLDGQTRRTRSPVRGRPNREGRAA